MPRKRIPTSTNSPAAATALLDDDEELVEQTTTTKKIGRQKRTIPEPEPEPDDTFIDVDVEEENETPAFSQTSLAAMIFGDDGETIEDQFCTVAIRRKPDTMRDKFAVPCSSVTNLPRLSNIALSTEQADIEDQVRSEYGGGHYYFQIYFDGRLGRSWQSTLSDLPGWKPQTDQANEQAAVVTTAPAVNPVDSFIESLTKTQTLKTLLFGDEKDRYEREITDLKTRLETAQAAKPDEPRSEEYLLWKMANEMPASEARTRLLDKLTPTDENGNRHWIADVASVAIENKDMILGFLGSLFGGMQQPAAPPSVTDLLRQPAPPALPTRPSVFGKRDSLTTAEPASAPEAVDIPVDITAGDESAIEAEVTQEEKPNGKRSRTAS